MSVNRVDLNPRNRSRRGGFTLIEMMVVIGIILVLVGITVAAISQVAKHTKNQRTQTALETGRSLWAGYIAYDKTMSAYNALFVNTNTPNVVGDLVPDPNNKTILVLAACPGAKGQHNLNTINNPPSGDVRLAKAIDLTRAVMTVLRQAPENRAIIDKLPGDARYVLTDQNGNPLDPPLLADGNGEPILFVPANGMTGVAVNNGSSSSSSGTATTYTIQSDSFMSTTVSPPRMVSRGNAQPFWAAAGADRDFTLGDDNLYSFQQ